MGLPSFLSYIPFCARILEKPAMRILILGLNGGVGKTTVLYRIKLGININPPCTAGFNSETVELNNMKFEMFDMGGGAKLIPLWKHYFPGTKAVIFVIDSTDKDRHALYLVENELTRLFNTEEIKNVPFLLLANKQDKPDAMSVDELKTALKLDNCKNHNIHIVAAVATEGTGLNEGLEWMCEELSRTEN